MALRTYDPKETTITFGNIIFNGFAEEKVTISYQDDSYDLAIGCDGESTRVRKNNNSAQITITLQQSSPTNDKLSVVSLIDRNTNLGILPLAIRDNSGTTVAFAPSAYIMKTPDLTLANTNQTCQWVFVTDLLGFHLGSNAITPNNVTETLEATDFDYVKGAAENETIPKIGVQNTKIIPEIAF